MKLKRINTIYFSPTGGTAEIVRFIARELAALLHLEEREIDLTRPENRKMQLQLGCDELLIMASPVYAGRLPNKLLPDYHALLHGEVFSLCEDIKHTCLQENSPMLFPIFQH